MGGDYYDRDVYNSGIDYSDTANKALCTNCLHPSLDPLRFEETTLKSEYRNPIVFALDVTGSMGEWTKVSILIN
jgi:hypothetical protein